MGKAQENGEMMNVSSCEEQEILDLKYVFTM